MKQNFNFTSSHDAMGSFLDNVESQYQKEGDHVLSGLSTGYDDIDFMTGGLVGGNFYVIAGRPTSGKSTLMRNISEHVSLTNDSFVFYLDFTTPIASLQESQMASLARVSSQKIKGGYLDDACWERMAGTAGLIMEKQKLTYGDFNMSLLGDVIAQVEAAIELHPLSLVCIDSMHLIGTNHYRDNRYAQIAEISGAIKKLAMKHNIPIIATSPLNRNLELRMDKRPLLIDLRDSGTIEDDADVIMFTYRDELYNEDSQDKGSAEIIFAKQKTQPIGKVRLAFSEQYSRFDNFVPHQN
jgi:replicative DNA helicase